MAEGREMRMSYEGMAPPQQDSSNPRTKVGSGSIGRTDDSSMPRLQPMYTRADEVSGLKLKIDLLEQQIM